MAKLSPKSYDSFERYANLVLHSYDPKNARVKSQEEILNKLQSYYPKHTKFVILTMDMDYMVNCSKPQNNKFEEQLQEVRKLKGNSYKNTIYPFIHADPRRLEDDKDYFETFKEHITSRSFQGIKIYPALGYFPFDRRLKKVYDLALEYNLPITTHCSIGPVFYRGKLSTLEGEAYYDDKKEEFMHPFTNNILEGKNAKEFTPHFTHPLNYYCLMGMPDKLLEYWQKCDKKSGYQTDYKSEDLRKYKDLKFCLGHYGGSEEWGKYLKDPWLPGRGSALTVNNELVHKPGGRWIHKQNGEEPEEAIPHSWHSIISDMLSKKDEDENISFRNLYSDISYNLLKTDLLPLLKVRLEANPNIAKKLLFGTDFYMVSTEASERQITMTIRSHIGEDNFARISWKNPLRFLKSNLISKSTLKEIDKNN